GQVRVDGKRAKANARLEAGQTVRVPPLPEVPEGDRPAPKRRVSAEDAAFVRSLVLHEDRDLFVLNKPFGLAVQGGSKTVRHLDGMLDALAGPDGERPRLVHRLDRDTSGVLVLARTRQAASQLGKVFRSRSARKIYWAVLHGVPKPAQGKITAALAKVAAADGEKVVPVDPNDEEAMRAVTYYSVIEKAGQKFAWVSLKPVTGRTHQLRAHTALIGHPIVGDPKYGLEEIAKEGRELGGIENKLHLMARRLVIPHPRGGTLDITAPLPEHMRRSFDKLGFDTSAYDMLAEADVD
ncbi:MAG TPA: RluA family pseudouridine synthase, partial [Hyphomicrobiales bacterium]|nr:RluA family pseudouridine synthase [Hyphomicrobiales bacterium]